MRLDMDDMQEALKAHDAWMEDVSQSLQEAHERCHQLGEDIHEQQEQTQAKLDAKTDIVAWNDMNDDIGASIKTVRDMASALRPIVRTCLGSQRLDAHALRERHRRLHVVGLSSRASSGKVASSRVSSEKLHAAESRRKVARSRVP
jgi:lactate dehydrogenase-like 2-hydroxyacid dehydrogenase